MIYRKTKSLFNSFSMFLNQITKDAMLFMASLAPILSGIFIRFGIPYFEKVLTKYFLCEEILEPYYLVFDLFLAVLTPLMFCFISAMVILGEIDDKISGYLAVTPLSKRGYLISRLGIPMIISIIVTVIILQIFSLTGLSFLMVLGISFSVSLTGFMLSLMIVSLSSNKVEGLAVTKLTGIMLMGIPIPFFISQNIQYIGFFLPTFWLGKFAFERNMLYYLFNIITSIFWIMILWKRFNVKIR